MSKILVVDDQKTVCYSLQRFLQSEGYDVIPAVNGRDALARKKVKGITAESLKKLEGHTWRGNVRELENTIQKTIVFYNSDYLSVECFDKLDERRICCDNLDDTI